MNVLLINGSPRGSKSNTYRLSSAFLKGMKSQGETVVEELTVSRLEIHPCLGCFACWSKTPGQCCIKDDMQSVIEKMLWADITVWSFPLYYFSVPGGLKNLIDRQLPMVLPFMTDAASGGHPSRYDMTGKRTVVISTCGFYTARGNYDGVMALFDHMYGENGYTTIFCGQGELFRVPELRERTDAYLRAVEQAGREFFTGAISAGTRRELEELLYPREVFETMADASWGLDSQTGQREDESVAFTRQMAALYRKEAYPGHDLVLEMEYTDLNRRIQIVLGKEGSRVLTADFLPPTTQILTTYALWRDIAAGKISGQDALMEGKYRVLGDFNLMIHWDDYFGGAGSGGAEAPKALEKSGKTTMNALLLPWILFWVAAPMDRFVGSLVSLVGCALTAVLFFRNRKTIYDVLSGALVTAGCVALLAGAPGQIVMPLSYLAFGVMWTGSCFTKIPLSAHYSMNEYDGEQALGNPLFMKTNWILSLLWGILYLLTPIWTYFLMGSPIAAWTGAVNSVCPLVMGIFTAWFQRWYPAKVARG